jgi:hypothetical protein
VLETINGFDLLLVIVIVGLVFKVLNLNAECNSYVQQILQVSWELQEEVQANKYNYKCVYCVGIEEKVTGDECFCNPPF